MVRITLELVLLWGSLLSVAPTLLDASTNFGTNNTEKHSQCVCEVVETAMMVQNSHESTVQGYYHFECLAAPGQTTFKAIELNVDKNEAFYVDNKTANRSSRWFISFPCQWVEEGKLPPEKNDQVHTLSNEEILALFNPAETARRLRRGQHSKHNENFVDENDNYNIMLGNNINMLWSNRRRRLSYLGKMECGIVIVHAKDKRNELSMAIAEDIVYKQADKQMRDCSRGQVELVKKDETIEITLPMNIGSYSSGSVHTHVLNEICKYHAYKYGDGCNIAEKRGLDHSKCVCVNLCVRWCKTVFGTRSISASSLAELSLCLCGLLQSFCHCPMVCQTIRLVTFGVKEVLVTIESFPFTAEEAT